MPAPTVATYSPAALAAANASFRDLLDAGLSAGSINIRSASDVLLAQIPLTRPCGAVDMTTGQLTLTTSGRDESADAGGAAAYGEFCDAAGVVHLRLPAQAGVAPVSGVLVVSPLTIVAGAPVELLSAVVG